ncbi:hypothetical protein BDW69DRAFT_180542 [Aspergillus filifer]
MKATTRLHTRSTSRTATPAGRGSHHDRLKGKHLEQLENKYGEEVLKHNLLNLQEQAQALRRPSLVQDIQGYDVYIGTSIKEYYDHACDTKIILHNRSTQKCQWFYTLERPAEDFKPESLWKRQENYFPCGHFLCDHGTQKIWLGAISADDRQKLIDIWNGVPEQPSREFAEEVLLVCARYKILSGERVQAALVALDEIIARMEKEMDEEIRGQMESQ